MLRPPEVRFELGKRPLRAAGAELSKLQRTYPISAPATELEVPIERV